MSHTKAAFILQGRSDFDALSGFNRELASCLQEMGIEPFVVNLLDNDETLKTINRVLRDYGRQKIIAAFSFSGVGMELGEGSPDGNVWQFTKIPVISWMMDHPCYILKRHALSVPAIIRIYPSTNFLHFQNIYIKSSGRNIFCPMGTMSHGRTALKREPIKDETPTIIFAKTLGDIEGLQQRWTRLPKIMHSIIRDAIDHYWEQTNRQGSVVASVIKAATVYGLDLESDLNLFCFFLAQVDIYTRWLKGNILFKELLNLPIRIYGKDIQHIDTSHAKAKVFPAINFSELMEEYREALAIISMNPNADDGCHDRVYSALGTGALPISDTGPWWEEKFPELTRYSYNFRDRSIVEAVEKVIDDPQTAASVAWEVGQRARKERPFRKAVQETLEWALMQRYFEFDFATPLDSYVRET